MKRFWDSRPKPCYSGLNLLLDKNTTNNLRFHNGCQIANCFCKFGPGANLCAKFNSQAKGFVLKFSSKSKYKDFHPKFQTYSRVIALLYQ